jgi:hypothetical protein
VIRFCPFGPCAAALVMADERAAPGPDPEVVVRYPRHDVDNATLDHFQCPASLMTFPLTGQMAAHLGAAAGELERQLTERAARTVGREPIRQARPRAGESAWFRWTGGGPTGRHDGYVAPPVMPQVLMPDPFDDQEGPTS